MHTNVTRPVSNKHSIPRRIIVADVLSSRYSAGQRPTSWDRRESGFDRIRSTEGEEIELYCTGGQSTPAAGWELLLTKEITIPSGSPSKAFAWTLYGIKAAH